MPESKIQEALDIFSRNFNCAQSVYTAFAEELGLDRDICLKTASAFGGGMGRQQLTCGAVTGALMVLGHMHGKYRDDDSTNARAYEKVRQFSRDFERICGSIKCLELLGCDINSEEGMQLVKEKDLFNTSCTRFIEEAVKLLQKMKGEE